MREVLIAGVGMTPFGKHPDKSCAAMAQDAIRSALADAGGVPADLESVLYANTSQGAIEGQFGIKGQHALRGMGIGGIPCINIENACSGSTSALHLAVMQVAGGFADVVLAVGTEKLHTDDRERRLAAFSQPADLAQITAFVEHHAALVADVQPPPEAVIDDKARSVFMDAYAINARLHMRQYGTTWRQIAAVAAKNHHHSTMNPRSQYRNDISVDEVLKARVIAWPLTLPMCAPISDGAAAAIVCTRAALARFDAKRAIRILACGMRCGTDRAATDTERSAARRAADIAYAQAGITPADISVVELHDASAAAEITQLEQLRLCAPGEGGPDAERGVTALGGRMPVNLSGGLISKGHPVGATGLGQIFELVTQLRGEAGPRNTRDPHYALACNVGGFIGVEEAVACVTILGK